MPCPYICYAFLLGPPAAALLYGLYCSGCLGALPPWVSGWDLAGVCGGAQQMHPARVHTLAYQISLECPSLH